MLAFIALFVGGNINVENIQDHSSLAVSIPQDWANREVIIRAWMEPDEKAPTWNNQSTLEQKPNRNTPYQSEQTLTYPGKQWDWPRYCLLREFIAPATAVNAGENEISFDSDFDIRGEVTVGTTPTKYRMCGQTIHARKKVSLDGNDWRFKLVRDYDEGEKVRLSGFKGVRSKIEVPSNWEIAGFSKPTYGQWRDESPTIGMYDRSFDLKTSSKTRTHLAFDGASNNTTVWLNGKWIGEHESGYTPFNYDITDTLSKGKNDLALRVSKYCRSSFFENAGQGGYWYLGGVFRPVYLYQTPTTYLSGFRYDPVFSKDYKTAKVTVTAEVTITDPSVPEGSIEVQLTSPTGKTFKAKSSPVSFATGTKGWTSMRLVKVDLDVDNVALWNAETPQLYKLKIGLVTQGKTLDSVEDEIGLRELQIEGQLFKVNGVPVKLRGMCRHDFSPTDGYATKPELWKKDLELMREAGINAVRYSHYAPAEGFVRLCEKMGFYVVHEAAAMWVGESADTWYPDYQVRAAETQRRDMNRACVLMWGLGNEHSDTVNFRRAALFCRRNDTRPVVYAGSVSSLDGDIVTPHYTGKRIVESLLVQPLRPVVCTEDYTQSRGWWPADKVSFADDFKSYWDDVILPENRINGMFIWEWDERAVIYKNSILLSNTKDYGVNNYESQVGPFRKTNLPWFNLLKEVYAPIRIDGKVEGGDYRFTIRNQYDFTSFGDVKVVYKVNELGETMKQGQELARGEKAIHLPARSVSQELIIPASSSMKWRRIDVEILSSGKKIAARSLYIEPTEDSQLMVTDVKTGILSPSDLGVPHREPPVPEDETWLTDADRQAVITHTTGKLKKLVTSTHSIPISGLVPNLWITPPAASMGGFPDRKESMDWGKIRYAPATIDANEGSFNITSESTLGDAKPVQLKTTTDLVKEGVRIRYELTYKGQEVQVPAVGVRFELPGSFTSWKWRGLGPWATYPGLQLGAQPEIYEAPIIAKRKVGPSIPLTEEPLIGQWEEKGGTKSAVDRFWIGGPEGTLEIRLAKRAYVEIERVGDHVEVRINAKVAECGDRHVLLESIQGEIVVCWPK